MAVDIRIIKDKVKKNGFFSGRREIIEYLTGENLDPMEEYAILITREHAVVITPHEIKCKETDDAVLYEGYSPVTYQNKLQNIMACLKEMTVPDRILMCRGSEQNIYIEAFRSMGRQTQDCSAWFKHEAMTKTEEQVNRIRECVEINNRAYRSVREHFKAGMNEFDVYRLIQESYYRTSGENIPFISDIVSGLRSCGVSGQPTTYRPGRGDTMILDLLPRSNGVYCDHTRTFFLGAADEKQRYLYRLLLRALANAEKLLKPGESGKNIYRAVYETFQEASLGGYFPHHAGHGFGLTIYEAPYFIKEEGDILQPKMTVAIEPGIYLPGEYGIRLENNYLITKDGFELLGNIPADMEAYVIAGE